MATKVSIVCMALCALIVISNGASLKKREVNQTSVVSDDSQAILKLFEEFKNGIKQLDAGEVTLNGILQNLTAKAAQFDDEIQEIWKEFGSNVQEAAKKHGIS